MSLLGTEWKIQRKAEMKLLIQSQCKIWGLDLRKGKMWKNCSHGRDHLGKRERERKSKGEKRSWKGGESVGQSGREQRGERKQVREPSPFGGLSLRILILVIFLSGVQLNRLSTWRHPREHWLPCDIFHKGLWSWKTKSQMAVNSVLPEDTTQQ